MTEQSSERNAIARIIRRAIFDMNFGGENPIRAAAREKLADEAADAIIAARAPSPSSVEVIEHCAKIADQMAAETSARISEHRPDGFVASIIANSAATMTSVANRIRALAATPAMPAPADTTRRPYETGDEFDHRMRMATFTPEQRAIVNAATAPPADAEPVALLFEELRSRADVAEAEGTMTAKCDARYFRKAADALAARPASPVMAEVEKALIDIGAALDGERKTVNPNNAFEHFRPLNRKAIEARKIARAALAKLRAERGES